MIIGLCMTPIHPHMTSEDNITSICISITRITNICLIYTCI